MYLYVTRVSAGQASPTKVTDWAVRLTEKINQISEVPCSLWMNSMSPGMGTFAFTSVVEDLATVEATETKLAVDAGYNALVDEAVQLQLLSATQPVDQTLLELVNPNPDAAAANAQYATTVRARLLPGAYLTGMQLGVELAQQVTQITGQHTTFAAEVTGDYGAVGWIGLYESIEALQAGQRAINSNADFARRIDQEASKAYSPGTQTISRKIV